MGTNHLPVRPLRKRFQSKFQLDASGCWLWIGAKKELGYGVIGLGSRSDGTAKAHRVAWQLYRGPIPSGMNVLHRCDRPECVNPDHLFLGTLSDNMKDCVAKGRNFIPDNRGERAKWRKLNLDQAKEIIAAKGLVPARYLAKRYGVSRSAIAEIWRGKNWQCAR